MTTRAIRAIIFTIAAAGAVAGISCGSSKGKGERGNANAQDNSQPPVTVTVGKSEGRDIPAVITATGSLAAMEESNVAPKIAGKLSNVYVNVGQFVSQGALLAKVDDHDAKLALMTAQANVKQAQASVAQAEAKLGLLGGGKFNATIVPEVLNAKANLDQAVFEQKQAEANEKRYRELTETGDVAMITYEQYKTARDTARAKTNAARQLLDSTINTAKQSNQAIVSAQAAVDSAKTQVATAQMNLTDTAIKAPFSGYISARPVAVGEYVSSASVIVTLLRTDPIKAMIQVAEADVPAATIGHAVTIQVDAYKDRKFSGTVTAVNPSVDATSRSAVVEAQIQNGDNALRQGMFVIANITREGGSKGVFVPKSAVYFDQPTQAYKVFVIQDGVAKLKVVQLGPEEGDSQQIISGIDPDLVVATSNLEKLYEGAKVAY